MTLPETPYGDHDWVRASCSGIRSRKSSWVMTMRSAGVRGRGVPRGRCAGAGYRRGAVAAGSGVGPVVGARLTTRRATTAQTIRQATGMTVQVRIFCERG